MKIKIDPLDKLFSEYIRKRAMNRVGGCERCLSPKADYKQLQCSHFYGRARKSVRWDEDNAVGLCFGCHQHFTSHPFEYGTWFMIHLNEHKFSLLNARMRNMSKPDKELIRLYLEQKIKELENEHTT